MQPPSTTRARSVTRFHYGPPVILHGRGATSELGPEFAEHGIDSVLVVCNRSIGETAEVLEPVIDGLEGRCAGVFDTVTGQKRLETAWSAAAHARALTADGILGLGAGSALDVATVASALVDCPGSLAEVRDAFLETRRIPLETQPVPLVTVPTTLAGAELSQGAGIRAYPPGTDDRPVSGGISDPKLCPRVTVYDADLVVQTPEQILRNSAMNGFNKGVEALYSPAATPVTDATASRGIGLLRQWLPTLADEPATPAALDAILEGMVLVQYGLSRPSETGLSVIHAFGHGITANLDVQQGVAHAIITPHVLQAVFERGECRWQLIGDALGTNSRSDIIESITELRDHLGLPATLGSIGPITSEVLVDIATDTAADGLMDNLPDGVTLSVDEIHQILEAAR